MNIFKRIKNYHFELRHLIILFAVLALFQTLLSYINNTSTSKLLNKTMEIYRKDSAENLSDLTATSLEFLLEHELSVKQTETSRKNTIRDFNIILSQQTLQQHVSEICVLILTDDGILAIDEGEDLYTYFIDQGSLPDNKVGQHVTAINYFSKYRQAVVEDEQIKSFLDDSHAFHVFVPFVPTGELIGALYMKISPDFSDIANEISSAYDETGAIFSALILLGLLVSFYVSSYMLKERDQTQQLLFAERQIKIRREIEHQKEAMFTQRIYHAHHKAEKIMGFIKTDLRTLAGRDQEKVINKLLKYSNFVSRVIYDMKSYDPPVNVIRNPLFRTDINKVIQFIVDHIFCRVFKQEEESQFQLQLDSKLPVVGINEYVIWEIIEPLIQNCIDHNPVGNVSICITTHYDFENNISSVVIEDNGKGISEELLRTNDKGIKKIFLEHTTTKSQSENSGYGCYLAYEICTKRCGWQLDVENGTAGGARFFITIPHD